MARPMRIKLTHDSYSSITANNRNAFIYLFQHCSLCKTIASNYSSESITIARDLEAWNTSANASWISKFDIHIENPHISKVRWACWYHWARTSFWFRSALLWPAVKCSRLTEYYRYVVSYPTRQKLISRYLTTVGRGAAWPSTKTWDTRVYSRIRLIPEKAGCTLLTIQVTGFQGRGQATYSIAFLLSLSKYARGSND